LISVLSIDNFRSIISQGQWPAIRFDVGASQSYRPAEIIFMNISILIITPQKTY